MGGIDAVVVFISSPPMIPLLLYYRISPRIAKSGFSFREIYEELPVTFSNPTIINALLEELYVSRRDFDSDLDRLDLSSISFLEKVGIILSAFKKSTA